VRQTRCLDSDCAGRADRQEREKLRGSFAPADTFVAEFLSFANIIRGNSSGTGNIYGSLPNMTRHSLQIPALLGEVVATLHAGDVILSNHCFECPQLPAGNSIRNYSSREHCLGDP